MKLGKTVRLELTADEMLTLAVHWLDGRQMRDAGFDPNTMDYRVADEAHATLKEKIRLGLRASRSAASGITISKADLWKSISDAAKE